MAEFQPITSQEQLDGLIGERLRRARETTEKQFEGYLSPEEHSKALSALKESLEASKNTLKERDGLISELNGKIKAYETDSVKTRIAVEMGLPMELRSRIQGEDEASIREDAEALLKVIGERKQAAPPMASHEPPVGDEKEAALRALAATL